MFLSPNSYRQPVKWTRPPSDTELLVRSEAGTTPPDSKHDPVKQIRGVMPQTTRKHFIIVLMPCLMNPLDNRPLECCILMIYLNYYWQ